jgi:hypothetical protein
MKVVCPFRLILLHCACQHIQRCIVSLYFVDGCTVCWVARIYIYRIFDPCSIPEGYSSLIYQGYQGFRAALLQLGVGLREVFEL